MTSIRSAEYRRSLIERAKLLLSTIDHLTTGEIAMALTAGKVLTREILHTMETRGLVTRCRALGERPGIHGATWVWRGASAYQCERCGQPAERLTVGLGPCCFDSMSDELVEAWDNNRMSGKAG